MKKVIIIVVALLLLGTGLYFVRRYSQNKAKATPSSLPQMTVVTLTKDGFSPENVTIRKGSAVRWVNQSSVDQASVNSDNYPDNKLYPELNLGQFKNGASLVHVFNNSGTYTYHNQFNPKVLGTVIVKD